MAEIKVDKVADELRTQIRRALSETLHEMHPDLEFDESELARAFIRTLKKKCHQWESIPADAVRLSTSELTREAGRRLS
jgi:hypothetical protein